MSSGPKVMLICSGSGISPGMNRALMEMAMKSFVTIAVSGPDPITLITPAMDFHMALQLKPMANLQPNNIKQLRREQRAREKRTSKMLPKGRR